jgi:RHS repeat-associated protein
VATYAYNAGDELTQSSSNPSCCTYNANGNLTSNGANTYSYDQNNQLIDLHLTSSYEYQFNYDGDGNRIRRLWLTGGSPVRAVDDTWDINQAVPQVATETASDPNFPPDSELSHYTYGVGRISKTTPDSRFYYHDDRLGSVTNLTSVTGVQERTYDYEPFGAVRQVTQDPATVDAGVSGNPMKFAGEELDENTAGLYYLRAREYDTATGRLLQRDPIEQSANGPGVSSYAYVADRPTTMVDPSGQTLHSADVGLYAALSTTSTGCVGRCSALRIDRSRVVWYLRRWWNATNPKYIRAPGGFLGLGSSDDCTNFVSQALHFGGWSENDTWSYSNHDIFAGRGGTVRVPVMSLAWDNVSALASFAVSSGRGAQLASMTQAQLGDVVLADWDGGAPGSSFKPTHLMGITGLAADRKQIYIASHTHDRGPAFPLYNLPGTTDSIVKEAGGNPSFMLLHIR